MRTKSDLLFTEIAPFGWELISNRQKNSSWFCLGDIFFPMSWKANIIRHCDVHAWLHVLNIKLIWKRMRYANEGLNYSISNSSPHSGTGVCRGWGSVQRTSQRKARHFLYGLILKKLGTSAPRVGPCRGSAMHIWNKNSVGLFIARAEWWKKWERGAQ